MPRPAALPASEPRVRCSRRRRELVLALVLGREIDEVLARVAVLRQRDRLAQRLAQARLERARERLELVAGVVDVELRRHRRALRPQEARERIADRRRARVDDHQRAGRVGRDELEADALPRLVLAAPVRGAIREDLAERAGAPRRGEEHVEEAGAGDLEPLHLGPRREVLHDGLGDLARRAAWRRAPAPSRRWWRSRRARSGAAPPRRSPRSTAIPRRRAPFARPRSVVRSGSSQIQNAARRRRSASSYGVDSNLHEELSSDAKPRRAACAGHRRRRGRCECAARNPCGVVGTDRRRRGLASRTTATSACAFSTDARPAPQRRLADRWRAGPLPHLRVRSDSMSYNY